MNAKTNTMTSMLKPGDRVQVVSTDGGFYQYGTLGMIGTVASIEQRGVSPVNVELPNGVTIGYAEHRLRLVADGKNADQEATPFDAEPQLFTIAVDGDSFDFATTGELNMNAAAKAREPELLPAGTQVIVNGTNPNKPGMKPLAGLFGMITETGPLHGVTDVGSSFDYAVHLTDGRTLLCKRDDVSLVVEPQQVDPSHPIAIMERLLTLRTTEKQMMAELSKIRDEQHQAQCREQSLRAAGDKLRDDRKAVVRQCEELEYSLTDAIAKAA